MILFHTTLMQNATTTTTNTLMVTPVANMVAAETVTDIIKGFIKEVQNENKTRSDRFLSIA